MATVTLEGAKIAFEERGRGEAVLLLHGWNGTRKQWLLNLRALAPRFRAIAPDLPGFGESQEGSFEYTLDGMSAFVRSFAEALRLSSFHLVGHSLGGCIAIRHAAARPEAVRKLVLVSTPTRTASLGVRALLPGARYSASATYRFRGKVALRWGFYRGVHRPEEVDLDFVRANLKASELTTRRALSLSTRMVRGMDLSPDLESIERPTLIVFGDKDRRVNPREAPRQRELLAQPYMVLLTSCGHCPLFERPRLFNTVLRDFLEDEGLGGTIGDP